MERLAAILHRFGFLITLALFGVALVVLYEAIKRYGFGDVLSSLRALAPWQLVTALGLTAAGYLALCGYDYLAFVYLRHPLPARKVALAAFIGYAFTNSAGHSVLSGGSVRFRLYSVWGLTPVEISKLLIFCFATFHLGMWALEAALFMAFPVRVGELLRIGPLATAALGVALMAAVVAYIVWTVVRKRPLRMRKLELDIPTLPVTLGQIAVVAIDVVLAAGVVYVLVPDRGGVGLGAFVAIYLVALLGGYISQVPGGLGILEGLMILLLPTLNEAEVLGAMLAYRVIYCLIPLCLAVLLLGIFEVRKEPEVSRVAQIAARSEEWLVPNTLAAFMFIAGGILLMSGATPAPFGRLERLNQLVPLAVMESAHLLATVSGLVLLVLAQGLRLRLAAAWVLGLAALAAGAAASILAGGHYAGAAVLAVLLAALLPCRRHFFRGAPLSAMWLSPQWFGAVGTTILGACAVAFTAYRGSAAGHSWLTFALEAEAARSIRALVAVAGLAATLAALNGLRRAPPRPGLPEDGDLDRAAPIAAASPRCIAQLAIAGDKSLLFAGTGDAFIMFAARRHTWVALGDPVGPAERRTELAWDFWELSRRHGARTVFYKAHPDDVAIYLDLGLTALKVGEEARVDLQALPQRGPFPEATERALRGGWAIEVVPAAAVAARIGELRAVSDAWLAGRGGRERGFAEGRFDERGLGRTPAVVAARGGRIAAFGSLRLSGGREEMTIDLLRCGAEAPAQVLDLLFAGAMAWGAAQGYRWFSLGLSPLHGPETKSLAPFWQRVGAGAFRFGEHFESAAALREYKEKFAPAWSPRYLALPGGIRMGRCLRDLAALVSGE